MKINFRRELTGNDDGSQRIDPPRDLRSSRAREDTKAVDQEVVPDEFREEERGERRSGVVCNVSEGFARDRTAHLRWRRQPHL